MSVSLLLTLAGLSHAADDTQYRLFNLADGQTFVGEVIASQATGIQIKLPQGERLLPFSDLAGMQQATASDYASQPAWELAVSAPPTLLMELKRAAARIPAVNVWTVGSGWPAANVPIEKQAQAAVCAQDLSCLLRALEDTPERYVVAVSESDTGARFDTAHTTYSLRANETTQTREEDELYRALLTVLQLNTPPETRLPSKTPAAARPPTQVATETHKRGGRDARFVPIPGYAALRAGESEKAWLAAAIALPATALWVGATGNHAQTPIAHAGLGLVGFCAISVSANHLTLGPPTKVTSGDR